MRLCSLLATVVDASSYSRHKFCAALVKVFAQFHATQSTTCMTTGVVLSCCLAYIWHNSKMNLFGCCSIFPFFIVSFNYKWDVTHTIRDSVTLSCVAS